MFCKQPRQHIFIYLKLKNKQLEFTYSGSAFKSDTDGFLEEMVCEIQSTCLRAINNYLHQWFHIVSSNHFKEYIT